MQRMGSEAEGGIKGKRKGKREAIHLVRAQPGDVVHVYFQYHGNHDGVLLGHNILTNEALTALPSG